MSALEYMTYLGFGSMNAGIMLMVEPFMYEVSFAFVAFVYCAFASKTLNEDKHE